MPLFARQRLRFFTQRASQSAVAWSLAATVLRVCSGLLVLPLMVRKLPSEELGLWYVFLSLQGIAGLFDLGFSPAVTRAAGYLWAGAKELKAFGVAVVDSADTGAEPNHPLLNELVATMRLYYRFFGISSGLLMLLGGGAWIWIKTQHLPDAAGLRGCYALFVLGGFLNATGDLWPALLSGVNGVRIAQKLLLGAALINFLAGTFGLLGGLGLWSLVLGNIGSGFFLRTAGRIAFIRMLGAHFEAACSARMHLVRSLWPTAWRAGLVSLGSYLVLSANTLICSGFLDLRTTASYGLSLSVIALLTYASTIFTYVKLPLINQMRALGHRDRIVQLWIQRTRLSIGVFFLGALGMVSAGNVVLRTLGAKTEFLPTGELAFLLLIIGLEMHHVLYASLVTSENLNPFVKPALLSGGATLCLSLLLTPQLGVWGMLLAQGCVQAAYNNWWTVRRGIRGIGLSWVEYWQRYFRQPIRI